MSNIIQIGNALNRKMFDAQMSAGGGFGVRPEEKIPYEKLWLVGDRGEIMGEVTIPNWKETAALAELLVETICFVNKKKRRFISELWVNTHALDDLNLALQVFADPDAPQTEDDNDTA